MTTAFPGELLNNPRSEDRSCTGGQRLSEGSIYSIIFFPNVVVIKARRALKGGGNKGRKIR